MTERVHVRVSMREDGKTPRYELMVDREKMAELSWTEVLEMALQCTSVLRWGKQ